MKKVQNLLRINLYLTLSDHLKVHKIHLVYKSITWLFNILSFLTIIFAFYPLFTFLIIFKYLKNIFTNTFFFQK